MRIFPIIWLWALVTLASRSSFADEEECDFDRWYTGVSGAVLLPQGGSSVRRLGGAAVRGGYYLTENWAIEASAAWMEDSAGLSVDALGHLQGWDFYGDLFGYSRFDPFVTVGTGGWLGNDAGQVGPQAGLGAFYHLTNAWSLRAEAVSTLGLDTACEMLYGLSAGVQYSF